MAENSNNFESNLLESLIALNKQSETLNEYIHSFKNEVKEAITSDNVSITENLTPKSDNLNFEELELLTLTETEKKESEQPFSIKQETPQKQQNPTTTENKENGISEEKIVEQITANLEKTLAGLIKDEKDDVVKNTATINKSNANKVNDFFKKIAQETKQQTPSGTNKIDNTKESTTNDTASFLESFTPQELDNLSTFSNIELPVSSETENTKEPVRVSLNQPNKQATEQYNLFRTPESNKQENSPFANFTPTTFDSTLESYFTQLQNNKQILTPENIKFNDIQTLQQIVTPNTFLNQNISKYDQTVLNTTNLQQNTPTLFTPSAPSTQNNNTQFYSFQSNNPLDENDKQFNFKNASPETASPMYQQEAISLENYTNDETTENIASYFDGIDPVLDEILQNTKLTNQALEGIIQILPALAGGAGGGAQTPPPMSMPQSPPSFGGGMGGNSNQNNMQSPEGIPQIPRIRQQFLMIA